MRFHLNLVINNNTTLEYVQAKKLKRTITQKYNVGTANTVSYTHLTLPTTPYV